MSEAAVSFARVRPGDAQAVQEFVRGLSLESRRERFFAPVSELTPGQLERVVSGPGLSLAGWVAEQWRGQGLGEALVAMLIADARRCGIRTLGGLALSGNRAMRTLARKLGAILRPDADPDLIQMQWEIA